MSDIECLSFKTIDKGSLVGFANIYVPKWGIEIFNVSLLQKDGRRWISFPQKEIVDSTTQKKSYFPHMKFREKTHMDAFSEKVKQAIEKFCEMNPPNAPKQMDMFDDDCPF